MEFNILDTIDAAVREAEIFENHPVKELLLEEQLLYLQGLSLVMSVDNEIHNEEVAYLKVLLNSFDMESSLLDGLVEFAKQPDKATIQSFFKTFRRKPIAQLVLFDALMISYRDQQLHDNEAAIIDRYARQLEIPQGTQKDIHNLFHYLRHQNWEQGLVSLHSLHLNSAYFEHLLPYFEIDIRQIDFELHAAVREQQLTPISEQLNQALNWVKLSFHSNMTQSGTKQITSTPVDLYQLLNKPEIVLPWLQNLFDRKQLTLNSQQQLKLVAGEKAIELGSLKDSGIIFEVASHRFAVQPEAPLKAPIPLLASYLANVTEGGYELKLDSINDLNQLLQRLMLNNNIRIAESSKPTALQGYLYPFVDKPISGELIAIAGKNKLARTNKQGHAKNPIYDSMPLIHVLFSGKFRLAC